MNELILLFILFIISGTIITIYHFYEKKGMNILIIIMTILYLIMSFKTTNIFSFNINLNTIPMISLYMMFFIILEKHSKKELYEDIKLMIKTIVFSTIIFIIFTLFNQSINDSIIFNANHIIETIPILVSYILIPIVIYTIAKSYKYLQSNNKNFYINTIICTVLISIIETSVTTSIIYITHLDMRFSAQIILANCLLKIIIMFIYLGIIKLIISKRKWLS